MAGPEADARPDRPVVPPVATDLQISGPSDLDPTMTRISSLTTTVVDVPLDRPIRTAIHDIRSAGCILVDVETSDGVVGQGYAFAINGRRLGAFDVVIRDFADLVVGRSTGDAESIWQAIWDDCNPTGHAGITVSALGAVDIAIWDAHAKSLGVPLHSLFGTCRDRIATYASSGLWLSAGLEDLAREARGFVEQGFRAVKVRLGSPAIDEDVARVRTVREAVGPDVAIHADANQGFDVDHALALSRALETFEPAWLEEPVSYDDLAGHARIRREGPVPVATGETVFACGGIRKILEAGACDVLMPDLQRIGGYSEMRRATALAAEAGMPVSTHFFTEQSLTVAASTPGCASVEHIDWFAPLFTEQVELVDGNLLVPDRPGTGFRFDEAARARYRLV
jgi:L-alanine-DL-glutamate epimerase-like enolase superfamily enzyme